MRIPLRSAIESNAAPSISEATISFRAMCYNFGVREKTGQHPAVMPFSGVAQTFCGVLEKKHRSKRRFVEQVLNATLALYGAGLQLPDISPEPGYKPLGDWFERNKHMPLELELAVVYKIAGDTGVSSGC